MAIDDNTSYELTGAQVKDLASKINAKEDSADLAAVAESGSYNDLLNKPTIPAAQVNSDWDAASGVAQILNKPTLATVATSGSYSDLSNKPTIGNATLTIQKNGTSVDTFTANATSNKTINITVPTTAADVSALPDSTKYGASIAVSINTTDYKVTTTLKDQDGNTLGTAQVIDLPLESVVVNGSYDNTNKKIILTLQNGNTIDIPVADLVAGLQTEITAQNMLSSDLVDDTNHTHKFTTAADITKLAGIATGAEVNQNAFSNVKVGSTTVAADSKTDTLELVAGSNVTLTPDATNDKVTIAATDTTYSDATTSASGLMSATDKTKLNGIATGAEVNVQSDWNVTDNTSDAFIKNKPTIPTVNNGTLTIQKNGTTVQTFTANQSTNATADIAVPTDTSDLTNGAGYITSSGTAAKADQLATARTISLGTGATGTATSFDGSSNITIPVTDVKDAYVTWGGKPIYSAVSPDDAGCIDEFGHNKLAFLPANCIQVHYSTDGGSTWTDYGLTDAQKIQLVTYGDVSCVTGGATAATSSNVTNLKVRIRIATAASTTTTGTGSVYTDWRKVLLNVTDPNSDCNMTMRYRTIANYKSGTETWVDSGTTYPVRGGSGWNSIPRPSGWPVFGGNYANQTTQIGQLEFILSNTKLGNWGSKKGSIISIRMVGLSNWAMPSEMARTGRLYTISENKNATFPASVYADNDIYGYNLYNRDTSGNYGHIGTSSRPFKDIYLSDGIYNGSTHLNLPTTTGTLALTSDMPTVNNATLTIQKNGTTVNTFTANSSNNVTANIAVPTLSTTDTDPGEGSALAADTFLGVYDIAPSAIDGSRITDGTVTTNKLASNAVTAAKVDFSTFGVAATVDGPSSTTSKANGAAWASTDMYSGSVTLAAGTYLVIVTGSAVAFSAGGEQEWFNVTIDSTIVMTGSLAWFTGSVVGGNGVGIATIGTSGTHTVAYQLGAQGSRTCTLYSGSKISFVRIG